MKEGMIKDVATVNTAAINSVAIQWSSINHDTHSYDLYLKEVWARMQLAMAIYSYNYIWL